MDDPRAITKERLYRAAVGEARADYYVPKFLAFEESESSRRSWDLAVLFFGPFWFLYRRMFVAALVLGILAPALFYWLCGVAIGVVLQAPPQSWLWGVSSFIFNFLLMPVYANFLYFSSVQKRIGSLREKLPDDGAVLKTLAGSRPTSILACVVGPLVVAGVIAVVSYFETNREAASQISGVLAEISEVQSAVVKNYVANHIWPERASDLRFRDTIHSPYIDALKIDRGTISIRFGNQASPQIVGHFLSLRPSLAPTGATLWSCGYATQKGKDSPSGPTGIDMTNVDRRYLPWKCR
jgi:hypothetical protein